jgi:hypothetical protein
MIFSPALFFAPDVHLRTLEELFVDDVVRWHHLLTGFADFLTREIQINSVPWKAFIGKVQEEWREFILYVSTLTATCFCC